MHINQVNAPFPIERNSVFRQQNTALVPPKGKKEASPFCPGSFFIHSPISVNIYYKAETHILCDSPDHSHSTPNLGYNLYYWQCCRKLSYQQATKYL